jgi:polysaccharide chain length determinant protein (PEP-CTERM system associated)
MPNVYEASARIYVDTSSVLTPFLNNQIIQPDVTAQLTYVNSTLLGREHLLRVIQENNLAENARNDREMDAAVQRLRNSLVNVSDGVRGRPGNYITRISYRNSDRDTAIGVVSTLADSLVQGTLGATGEGAATAAQFLDERIAEYESRLQTAEQALADFKSQNSDRLPGAEGGYYVRIRAQQDQIVGVEEQLRLARSRADQLRVQLQSESPLIPIGAGFDNDLAPNSIDARIRDRQAELDRLLLDYTEKHPDVVNARAALVQLEAQRAEQLRALGVTDLNAELGSLGSSPVYQALRIALNEAQVEIASLEEDLRGRRERLAALQRLVDEVPQVEAELARLNRDYEVVYGQYQRLIQSRETQNLSTEAANTDDVDFRVIDAPFASFEPVAPNRTVLLSVALIFALGVGSALSWVLSEMRPVFVSVASLRKVVGLPVIGAISSALDGRARMRRRLSLIAFMGAMGLFGLTFAAVALIEILGPGLQSLAGLS